MSFLKKLCHKIDKIIFAYTAFWRGCLHKALIVLQNLYTKLWPFRPLLFLEQTIEIYTEIEF